MAKIHKGIGIADGFAYKGKALNFSRDVYDNFTDLLEDEAKYGFPDGFKVVVKDATVGSEDYYENKSYNNATFIYKFVDSTERMLNWHCVAYDHIDEYLYPIEEKLFRLQGIGGITHKTDSLMNSKYVWNTNGGYANLNEYALKSDVTTDLSNYVTNSALTTTLGSYAKLNNSANFSALTVGSKSVATQTWTEDKINTALTQALTYKGGIANQSDITNAEATGTIKVGNVYVCTTENNYTLNGGTVRLEAGDTIICKSITGTEKWNIVQANITGAVTKSSNLASGQLVVGTGLSSVKALDAGANGKFLKVENNVLTWGDVPLFNGKRNGLVPLPAEDVKTGSFLSMDGTWKIPYGDATTTTHGLMTAADKVKLNGIEAGANKYVLNVANDNSLGGIKIGYTEKAGEKKYKVQVSSDGKAFVYVPWTDTNTTYNDMNGATASSDGTHGLVPAPTAGQQGLFLCGNGTWAKPTDTIYTLKAATAGNLGGIKLGSTVSGQEPDTESYFYLQKDTNDVGYIDLSGAELTDTTYVEGEGIRIDTNTNTISNSGVRYIIQPTVNSSKLRVNTGGTEKEIVINNVAHATSSDSATNATHATSSDSATNATHATSADSANTATTATKVSNVLEIENYNPTGELVVANTYNGSSKITINCITVEEINGLFHS